MAYFLSSALLSIIAIFLGICRGRQKEERIMVMYRFTLLTCALETPHDGAETRRSARRTERRQPDRRVAQGPDRRRIARKRETRVVKIGRGLATKILTKKEHKNLRNSTLFAVARNLRGKGTTAAAGYLYEATNWRVGPPWNDICSSEPLDSLSSLEMAGCHEPVWL